MSFIDKLLHIAPGSSEKTGLLEKGKATGKSEDKSGLFGSTLAKFGEKVKKGDPKDQKEEIGVKKVKLSRGGLEVEISYPKSLIDKKGKSTSGKAISDPEILHDLSGKDPVSKEKSGGIEKNKKSDGSENLIEKDPKGIISAKNDKSSQASSLSAGNKDVKRKVLPGDEMVEPMDSEKTGKDVKLTVKTNGQVDKSDSSEKGMLDEDIKKVADSDQKKDKNHKVKEEKPDSVNPSVANHILQDDGAQVATKHPPENSKEVKGDTGSIGDNQQSVSNIPTKEKVDAEIVENTIQKDTSASRLSGEESKNISSIKTDHSHKDKVGKGISDSKKPVTIKSDRSANDTPNVVKDRYYGKRVVKNTVPSNEGPKDTVEIKGNSKPAIHNNHPGLSDSHSGIMDAKAVNSPFSMGGNKQHPGSNSEQQMSDKSQKLAQEINNSTDKQKDSVKDTKTTSRTTTIQSGNNSPTLNTSPVATPRQLAGKIVSVVQKTPSSSQDQQTWQKHRLVMDNGQTLNVSARTTDGVLHLQLSGGNQDLNKLLQQHLQEIRNHLQEQMNVKVDLQFQSQTGGESAQQFQQQTGNNGAFNNTSIFGNDLDDKTTETGPDMSGQQPLSTRRLGYNNTEWTA